MEDQAGLERIIVNNERIYIDVYAPGIMDTDSRKLLFKKHVCHT
jgi:hypothetical protein